MTELPRLVVVLGPTASGKSALGIALARELGGEVLVCDSTQVYCHFDIGTAKVLPQDRGGIPHHLIDLVEPAELFTAGDYRRHALVALQELKARSKVPVLTAGTGLYLRAILEGLADAPTRSEKLRQRLRRRADGRNQQYLHRILKRIDPQAADRIAPRDLQKTIRALEIRLLAGRSVAEVHGRGGEPLTGYKVIKIGLCPPRSQLYARIQARVDAMMAAGWLQEVRTLIASGMAKDAKPFQFIGYAELKAHLEGEMSLEAASAKTTQATRNLAKRQMTWFRKERKVSWLGCFGDDPEALAAALVLAKE